MSTFRMREGRDGLYYPVEDYMPIQALSNSPIVWPPREGKVAFVKDENTGLMEYVHDSLDDQLHQYDNHIRSIMEEKLLQLIEQKPGQTVFELARTLGENVGSVVEVLKGMVERGEIMRRTRRLNRFYPVKE